MTQSYATDRPMRLFALYGNGASAILDVLDQGVFCKNTGPKGQWIGYEFVGAFTNNPRATGTKSLRKYGIPCHSINWKTFVSNGAENKEDALFTRLAKIITESGADYIVLSGFMMIIPNWFIERFEKRIINVYPADLSVFSVQTKKPRYAGRGISACQKVIEDKLTHTRSTAVYAETKGIDEGEIIAFSDECSIITNGKKKDTPRKLQDRLNSIGGGQALERALNKLLRQKCPQ